VDLPEWEGVKAELEMISGADTLLDIVSQGDETVHIVISMESFENANMLELIGATTKEQQETTEVCGGAYYIMKNYEGIEFNLVLWLCNVTIFVFQEFPDKIYFKRSL
jgi:hypothetical protein